MIDQLSDNYANELAAFEQRMVDEMLGKHGLEGKTKEELRLMGYELYKAQEQDWGGTTVWRLYKFVDSVSYRAQIKITPGEVTGEEA